MGKKHVLLLAVAVSVLLLLAACGTASNSNNAGNTNNIGNPVDTGNTDTDTGTDNTGTVTGDTDTGTGTNTGTGDADTNTDNNGSTNAAEPTEDDIDITIDQSPKPIEGNSFDFGVNARPEGYALTEMRWVSEQTTVINTRSEAIEHGGNGEDGFYISGNGQMMGFFYPDEMKGEEGEAMFVFENEEGKQLIWKKALTLE